MEKYYIIYEITNLINSKKYRGMHQTYNINDNYLGSGKLIKNAIKKYGKQNFEKKILAIYPTYNDMVEAEKFFVDLSWIEIESTYNLKTGGHSAGILSDESKRKISETLKRKHRKGEITINRTYKKLTKEQKEQISNTLKEYYKIHEHLTKGNIPWNKNKKGLQQAWNKGLSTGPVSDETKLKKSKSLKEYYKTHEHPTKGNIPWNKNKKGLQQAWNKGLSTDKYECPYCKKMVDKANLKRWHLQNCKLYDKSFTQ